MSKIECKISNEDKIIIEYNERMNSAIRDIVDAMVDKGWGVSNINKLAEKIRNGMLEPSLSLDETKI